MPSKKNGSKKKIKTTTNVLRNSHVVNQSGGRNAQLLLRATVGENFNNKNVFTLLNKKIADNCVKRLKDSKSKPNFIFTAGKIELIRKAIEKEVENSNNLSAPVPSIIAEAEDKMRSDFIEEFTDTKLTEGPITIGEKVTDITQRYATMQEELNEECKKIEKSPEADNSITTTTTPDAGDYEQKVDTIEAAIKQKNTRFVDAINRIVEKNKAKEAEIIVPTVNEEGKLDCVTGIFAPIHGVVIAEDKVQQFDPASVLLQNVTQDVGTIINQHSVDQTLFSDSDDPKVASVPSPPPPGDGPPPPFDSGVSSSGKDKDDKLMVNKSTFSHFGEVVIQQLTALYAWISNLARQGIYNFKVSLSTFINKIEALLKSSLSIFVSVATLCIKHIWTCISLFATKCGFAIAKTAQAASKAYKANTQIVFATRPDGITLEEFNKICYTFDQGCGGKGLFFVEKNNEGRDVIIWKIVLSSVNDKCDQFVDKMQQLSQYIQSSLTIGRTTFMNYLFDSMSKLKEKLVKLKKFTDDHLSDEGIAALQKKCMAVCQKGGIVHIARKKLMRGIRAANLEVISRYKTSEEVIGGVARDVKNRIQNGTDRALFSIIFMAEETGLYSLADVMRMSSFRINLLTQTGYIRSLESKTARLTEMYDKLKVENKRLVEELYKNPLMRSTLKYNEFLQKVYGNIDKNPNSSYLIREAKKEELQFTSVIGSASGQQAIDYMVASHFGTQQSTVKKEIESSFKNNGMTPYVDLCRLLGILWDLHVLEETIDGKLQEKTNWDTIKRAVTALGKPVRQAIDMVRRQQTSIQVIRCDSDDRRNFLHKGLSALSKSPVIRMAATTGVSLSQAYWIKKAIDEKSTQSPVSVSPLTTIAPIAAYYGLTLLVNAINHHTEKFLPMCMVLSCKNGTTLKLPVYSISRVSTVFSDPAVMVQKGMEDKFDLRPKKVWLNAFLSYLSEDEKAAIKDAIEKIRSRILEEICSSEEYYSRRDKIFMDKVFGTDIQELSRIYSRDQQEEGNSLSLKEILQTADVVDKPPTFTPTSTETTFTIEYRYWMLLKAIEMKYNQSTPGTKPQTELPKGPSQVYIAAINEYYHDNINAKMEFFMSKVAELKARQDVSMQKAKEFTLRTLRAKLTSLEGLQSSLKSVKLLEDTIREFIDNIEKEGIDGADLEILEAINRQYAAHLQDNGVLAEKTEVDRVRLEMQDIVAQRMRADEVNAELVKKLEAASSELKEEITKRKDEEAALAAAKADAEQREQKRKEEEDKQTKLLLQSILADIKRDNLYFNSMLEDLDNDVKQYIRKYRVNSDTNVEENVTIYDQVLFQKLDKFMEVVNGTHSDYLVYQRLNVLEKAITGSFNSLLSDRMRHERIGERLSDGTKKVHDLETIIDDIKKPLEKCQAFFTTLSGVSKIDSIESITANLKAQFGNDSVATSIGTSYMSRRIGGRNRKNKNRTRKCKISFTKKIRYVRKNRKNSKIKLSSRCRRK
jgi:hypothetical protein